jgi:Sec7-like guanine-nucleotide exchange factor
MKTKTKIKHSKNASRTTTSTTTSEDRKIFHIVVNGDLSQKQLNKICEAISKSNVFEDDKFLVTPGNIEIRRIA